MRLAGLSCGWPPGVCFPEDAADEVQKQKQLLKDAAAFLVSCQVPLLVSGAASSGFPDAGWLKKQPQKTRVLCEQVKDCLDHSALPMDGATLTEALHQRGINVRYLGSVLEFVEKTPAKAQLEHVYVSLTYERMSGTGLGSVI